MHCSALPVSLLCVYPTLLHRRLPPLPRRRTPSRKLLTWPSCIRAENDTNLEDPLEVEDIDREYCNDFICTSSPYVEETIKAFAVDLQRPGRWTLTRFPEDVTYKDPFRSFRGIEKYERLNWISESVERPRVKVHKLKMVERDMASVDWSLTGTLLNQPIDVDFQSIIKLNLLSGRIMEHRDAWDLRKCSPLASVVFTASRSLWSIRQFQQDAMDGLQQLGHKLGFEDEDSSPYFVDPRDPYTFYEKPDQDFKRDALSFLTFVAVLYLIYRAYAFIFQI